jgi:hypothetical protein
MMMLLGIPVGASSFAEGLFDEVVELVAGCVVVTVAGGGFLTGSVGRGRGIRILSWAELCLMGVAQIINAVSRKRT